MSTYKIIGGDGREYGPIAAEQVQQWVAEGRANAQTRVLAEGSTEWKPLGSYPELLPATSPAPSVSPPGAPAIVGAEPTIEEIVARDYQIGIGECLTKGWELVKANLGFFVGGTVLIFFLQGLVQSPFNIGRMLVQFGHFKPVALVAGGFLAVIGLVAMLVLSGPLKAGLYWPYLLRLRGQPAEIRDFFEGFRRGFVNLMLCQIVMGLLIGAVIVPPAIVLGAGAALHFAKHSAAGIGLMVAGGVLLFVALLFVFYLATCWFFALPLAVDKRLGYWEALKLSKRKVSQHWWQVFGLTFVAGLVGSLGILLCCVGVIFTMPIALASFMAGYEVIFGRRTA